MKVVNLYGIDLRDFSWSEVGVHPNRKLCFERAEVLDMCGCPIGKKAIECLAGAFPRLVQLTIQGDTFLGSHLVTDGLGNFTLAMKLQKHSPLFKNVTLLDAFPHKSSARFSRRFWESFEKIVIRGNFFLGPESFPNFPSYSIKSLPNLRKLLICASMKFPTTQEELCEFPKLMKQIANLLPYGKMLDDSSSTEKQICLADASITVKWIRPSFIPGPSWDAASDRFKNDVLLRALDGRVEGMTSSQVEEFSWIIEQFTL